MTQIVTVSAATAAYATEGLRPSSRVSGSAHTYETTHEQVMEARAADNLRHVEMQNVVGPPAITVFFLTAGERGRQLAQATLREAEEAYFFGKEEVEETDGRDEDSRRETEDDRADDEEFREQQTKVFALPAPEDLS